ncbi:MAG: polysaccharide (de)acetylase [Bacteroidota bacterium]|nr:polysaccharide (de)acetylase [Bacteroidota bacterium]
MIRRLFGTNQLNSLGWKTKRKIVVIESDDWGSIRMPSKRVFDSMEAGGIPLHKCPYNKFDSLESEMDLQELFNVLTSFKDGNGNSPIITANTVMANPDFDKIKESNFEKYFFETFDETYKKYPGRQNSINLFKQGINEKIFFPQFHGREHININLWLKLLRSNNKTFVKAFDNGFWGIGPLIEKNGTPINIQASFDALDVSELESQYEIILEGLNLFENIFKFRSSTFIANNFIWDSGINEVLSKTGVLAFQGMKYQLSPIYDGPKRKKERHYIGQKNNFGQLYLIRNCTFEPSVNEKIESVNSCLWEIGNSFFWEKPAVISSHRVNFIGSIVSDNRGQNLKLFKDLLSKILQKWPDVEFMTSAQLAQLITEKS